MSGRSSATCSRRSVGPTKSLAAGWRVRRAVRADYEVAAHASRQVDQHVGAAPADPFYGLAIKLEAPAALAGLGVSDVDVDDGRAGVRGVECSVRDLLWRDRKPRVLAHTVAGSGDRARDERGPIHNDRHDITLQKRRRSLDFSNSTMNTRRVAPGDTR